MTEPEPVFSWDTVAKTGSGLDTFSHASAGGDSGCDFGRDFDTAGDSRGDLRKGRGDFLSGGSRFRGNSVRDFDLVQSSHFSRACFC